MFQCILSIILITAYSSEGIPIPTPSNGSIASSLDSLGSRCHNTFLVNIIKSEISRCSHFEPPYNELALQCLIFYDINSQLCDAVAPSTTLHNNYMATINQSLDVGELCKEPIASHIVDLPEYPMFKPTVVKVLNNMILCAKVCGVPEIFSQDTNFFCKYFNWGINVLQSLHSVNKASTDEENAVHETPQSKKLYVPSEPVAIDQNQINPHNPVAVSAAYNPHPVVGLNKLAHADVSAPSSQTTKPAAATKTNNPVGDIEVEKPIDVNHDDATKLDVPKPVADRESLAKSTPKVEPDVKKSPPLDVIENPSNVGIDNLPDDLPKPETKVEETEIPQEKPSKYDGAKAKPKKSGVKKPEADADLADDYPDSEDGKDGLSDLPQAGDDGEDPLLTNLDTTKQGQSQPELVHKINTASSSYSGDKGRNKAKAAYESRQKKRVQFEKKIDTPNYQDGFPDSDDHFFTLFLTAIIMVVLLYVLYHNKNKLVKVVLGLIVEGRQSGGRRNSRGHAYRRLDTLEQAMSAPSSVAPTKIIY